MLDCPPSSGGCTSNTVIWAHEQGHAVFAQGKSRFASIFSMVLSLICIACLTYFALSGSLVALQACALAFVMMFCVEEAYAWFYAMRWWASGK